jgi:hypothetical protein
MESSWETRKGEDDLLGERKKKASVWVAAHIGSSVCGASLGLTRSVYKWTLFRGVDSVVHEHVFIKGLLRSPFYFPIREYFGTVFQKKYFGTGFIMHTLDGRRKWISSGLPYFMGLCCMKSANIL